MKYKFILLWALMLYSASTFSAHIIGGRLQYSYLGNKTFRFQLILDRDCQGGGASFELTSQVGLFNSSNNSKVASLNLNRDSIIKSPYNHSCEGITRCVEVGYFSAIIKLDSPIIQNYNDTNGYYLNWERCCLADDIKNITYPSETPFSVLLDIPKLSIIGDTSKVFINSSPKIIKPFNPLICSNINFEYQFNFFDPDGDSLSYKFLKPMAGGYTTIFNPQQNSGPKPYDNIEWEIPYSDTNFIDTENGLSLDSKTGFISMKPTQTGKYIFAFEVKEFRNGKPIGRVYYQSIFFINDCASVILTQPKDQYSIDNSPVTFYAKHSDTSVSYKWQLLKPNGASEFILNASADSLSLSTIDSSMNGYKYRCIMLKPTCNDYTNYATLYVLKTGIEKEFNQTIKLYPNPSSSIVYFEDKKERNVKIYSTSGKLISEKFNCSSFDISSLENGLYLIRSESEEGFGFSKLVKE